MARARNIKPGFFTNDDLVDLPFEVRLLFIGLWTLADKDGRFVDRPKKIKMEIFPADNVDCDNALSLLAGKGFVRRYQVGGVGYCQIINWSKHQNPHIKESPSVIPIENEVAPEIPVQTPVNAQPLPEQAGLIPSSLIPSSLIPDSLNPIPDPIEKHSPEKSGVTADKKKTISPLETLLSLGVEEQAAKDWLTVRKAKRAPFTETALNELKLEAGKAGISVGKAVVICVKRNWQGFNASWNWNDDANARASPTRPEKFDPTAYVNQGRKQTGGGNDGFINGTAERVA